MSYISKKDRPEIDHWAYVLRVKGLEFFRSDVVVKYDMGGGKPPKGRKNKGDIMEFTESSRKELAFVASNTEVVFTWMVTLTYPGDYETDGKEVKRHLNRFLSWARGFQPGIQYLWFLEFQSRGAPHFHILIDRPLDRSKVTARWYDAVGSGDARHYRAGTRVERIRKADGAKRYAVKYAMKMKQKTVPKNYQNVGRFWGNSKGVKPGCYGKIDVDLKPREFVQAMSFWDWKPALEKRPMGVLYNAAGSFGDIVSGIEGLEGK